MAPFIEQGNNFVSWWKPQSIFHRFFFLYYLSDLLKSILNRLYSVQKDWKLFYREDAHLFPLKLILNTFDSVCFSLSGSSCKQCWNQQATLNTSTVEIDRNRDQLSPELKGRVFHANSLAGQASWQYNWICLCFSCSVLYAGSHILICWKSVLTQNCVWCYTKHVNPILWISSVCPLCMCDLKCMMAKIWPRSCHHKRLQVRNRHKEKKM